MFQQPELLYLLPLAALPLIIHLLNRLRYKTVQWAAMMYLLAATRTSTRRARLRQILIMVSRILVLFFFIFALARPLAGGWLGWSFSGVPDTIVILLDRSASMEGQDPASQITKRKHALNLLSQAAGSFDGTSQLILIENVLREPRTLANAAALKDLPITQATQTGMDAAAMLRAAADYMQDNRTGRTEIWIASDLQLSNWTPGDASWETIRARLNALPQDVRVRLLALTGETPGNRAVRVSDVSSRVRDEQSRVELNLSIARDTADEEAIPITLNLNGQSTLLDLMIEGQDFTLRHTASTPNADSDGWGSVSLPADYATADNSAYFVYPRQIHRRTAVVTRDDSLANILMLASAPAPELLNQSATRASNASIGTLPWSELSMIVWQGTLPEGPDAALLESFVRDGGQVAFFPPGLPSENQFLGTRWGDVEEAAAGQPFTVASWQDNDGPLANAFDGTALPISDLSIKQRQAIVLDESDESTSIVLARHPDGHPVIARSTAGDGQAYFFNSLPHEDWSALIDGTVLVPVLQRILLTGSERLSTARSDICGIWQPESGAQPWLPVEGEGFRDPRWQAGVYRAGSELIALNPPEHEFDPMTMPQEQVNDLFGSIDVTTLNDKSRDRDDLQSEIWRLLVYFAMICLMVEGALIGPARKDRKKEAVTHA